MAVPSPTTWTPGNIPSAAQFNADIRDAITFFKAPPRSQVMHNATITRPSRTSWSLVPWNTEITDTDAMHDNVTNNSRLIAKTAGRYHVWVNITWEDHLVQAFEGDRGVQIRKNSAGSIVTGTLIGIDHRHCKTTAVGSQGASQQGCDGYVSLAVNDYVECFVYDADDGTSGGAVGCSLEPQVWAAQRFGMNWISI